MGKNRATWEMPDFERMELGVVRRVLLTMIYEATHDYIECFFPWHDSWEVEPVHIQLETIQECYWCTWSHEECENFDMYTWMNAPQVSKCASSNKEHPCISRKNLTEDLVTASTTIDNSNGINKPNSAAAIVENEAVAESVQANMTIISLSPHPTERQSVLVQANMTIINCTPQPTERHSVPVQVNMTIINCPPHTTVRQQSVNPET